MESIFKDNYEKIMVIDCFKKYGQGDAFYPNVKILESPEEYKNFVNDEKPYMKVGFEVVGGDYQQVKPYFDIDLKLDKNTIFEEDTRLVMWSNKIQEMFKLKNGKDIYIMKRPPREFKDKIKYSYHFVVDKIRITNTNMKTLINEFVLGEEWDTKPYQKNQGICAVYCNGKPLPHSPKYEEVEEFKPYGIWKGYLNDDEVDIYNYLISYIKEDFKNWDLNMVQEDKKLVFKEIVEDDDEEDSVEDTNDIYKTLKEKLLHIKTSRFDDYESWLYIMFAIINISKKYRISKSKQIILIHEASERSSKYDEADIDNWIDKLEASCESKKKGYGFPYLNNFIKEDDPEYYNKTIILKADTYENIKKDFDKYVFKCINPLGYIVINQNQDEIDQVPYFLYNQTELTLRFVEKKYIDKNKKGENVSKKFITKWLEDDTKKTYNSLTFKPYKLSLELNTKHFNLFNGYRASKITAYKDYECIKPILDHIKIVLANNREDVYNYLIQYFANIMQNAKNKTGVFVVFKGKQGCGKNTIVDLIANGIIGEYSVSCSNPEKVFFGTFNSLLANKVLAVANEMGNDMRNSMDRIKDTCVAPTVNIEKKCKDPTIFDNYINCIGTTNNDFPIQITEDDRRLVWLNCGDSMIGNTEYFNKLNDLVQDDYVISSLYHYLLEEVNITIKNFQIERPKTEEYKLIQVVNLPNYIKFFLHQGNPSTEDGFKFRKERGGENNIYLIKKTKLYAEYVRYCEMYKRTPIPYDIFYHKLKEETKCEEVQQKGVLKIRIIEKDYLKWGEKYKKLEKTARVVEENEYADPYITDDDK
jgi:hypothetical protein